MSFLTPTLFIINSIRILNLFETEPIASPTAKLTYFPYLQHMHSKFHFHLSPFLPFCLLRFLFSLPKGAKKFTAIHFPKTPFSFPAHFQHTTSATPHRQTKLPPPFFSLSFLSLSFFYNNAVFLPALPAEVRLSKHQEPVASFQPTPTPQYHTDPTLRETFTQHAAAEQNVNPPTKGKAPPPKLVQEPPAAPEPSNLDTPMDIVPTEPHPNTADESSPGQGAPPLPLPPPSQMNRQASHPEELLAHSAPSVSQQNPTTLASHTDHSLQESQPDSISMEIDEVNTADHPIVIDTSTSDVTPSSPRERPEESQPHPDAPIATPVDQPFFPPARRSLPWFPPPPPPTVLSPLTEDEEQLWAVRLRQLLRMIPEPLSSAISYSPYSLRIPEGWFHVTLARVYPRRDQFFAGQMWTHDPVLLRHFVRADTNILLRDKNLAAEDFL